MLVILRGPQGHLESLSGIIRGIIRGDERLPCQCASLCRVFPETVQFLAGFLQHLNAVTKDKVHLHEGVFEGIHLVRSGGLRLTLPGERIPERISLMRSGTFRLREMLVRLRGLTGLIRSVADGRRHRLSGFRDLEGGLRGTLIRGDEGFANGNGFFEGPDVPIYVSYEVLGVCLTAGGSASPAISHHLQVCSLNGLSAR